MKYIRFAALMLALTTSTFCIAQLGPDTTEGEMKNFFKSQEEVKGKTAYTELIINASPEKVRGAFLKLDEWPNWNSVIVKIDVIKGDMNDLSTQPRIDALFHMDTTKAPQPAPMKLWLTANSQQAFVWEVKNGVLLKARHVYLFLPEGGGKATRLVHYERMTGFLSLFFSKKLRKNMANRYSLMNEELKQLCEK